MPIRRAEMDTIEKFPTVVAVYADTFREARQQKNAVEGVQSSKDGFEARLKRVDAVMSNFLKETIDLTLWGVRMKVCVKQLYALDKNLAFTGKPQFDWDEVAQAMGFLLATIEGAEDTLHLNGVDI